MGQSTQQMDWDLTSIPGKKWKEAIIWEWRQTYENTVLIAVNYSGAKDEGWLWWGAKNPSGSAWLGDKYRVRFRIGKCQVIYMGEEGSDLTYTLN